VQAISGERARAAMTRGLARQGDRVRAWRSRVAVAANLPRWHGHVGENSPRGFVWMAAQQEEKMMDLDMHFERSRTSMVARDKFRDPGCISLILLIES